MTNIDIKLATLGTADLVKLYNATSRAQINRFADRATALKRTAAAIERVGAGELPGLLGQLGIVAPAGLKAQLDASLAEPEAVRLARITEAKAALRAEDKLAAELDPNQTAGGDAALPARKTIHDAGSKVTYASAAIAAGLTPKQARKVAERVADRVILENKVTGEKLLAPAATPATGKIEASAKQAAMLALLTRPQGANRKEILAAINAVAGASPSACIKLAELFGYDFHYTARTETTPTSYRLTPKAAK